MAGGFAGPATLCGIETQQEEIDYYGGYEDYDYQYQPGDYQPIDLQPNDDYQPSDYSTSKRAADDYEDYNPEKVGRDQSTLNQSNSDDIFYEDYIRGDYEYQEKKVSLNPVGNKPSFCEDPEVAPDAYTGGLVLKKAFMYNGLAWEELPPMSVRRDSPICSLIHNEDQVILLIYSRAQELFYNFISNFTK